MLQVIKKNTLGLIKYSEKNYYSSHSSKVHFL